MKHLLALVLLCASAAHAQTSTTEWVAVPVDPAASGASTETLCAAAVKKLYGASAACLKRIKTSAPAVQTWVRLVNENETFTVGTNQTVRFGLSPGPYVQKVVSGSAQCTRSFFGSDPAPGLLKACDVLQGSGTPVVVAPPPPPPVTGSATVSWTAPTTNADGSPLTDLAGYVVQYGPARGTYTGILSAPASPLVVPNLAAGAWFFVVQALDTSGNASALSAEVSKVIQ